MARVAKTPVVVSRNRSKESQFNVPSPRRKPSAAKKDSRGTAHVVILHAVEDAHRRLTATQRGAHAGALPAGSRLNDHGNRERCNADPAASGLRRDGSSAYN